MLLAAGASRRFGGQKLLAPWQGAPLVRRTAERVLAADVAELVVVLGREAEAVRTALHGLPVRCVVNRGYGTGLSGSLRRGVRAMAPQAAAVLVALGDQPTVDPAVIDRLIATWRAGSRPIVAPSYRGFRGNPVLFGRSLVPELLRLRGDEGARGIIAADPSRVTLVDVDSPPPPDVDVPADAPG